MTRIDLERSELRKLTTTRLPVAFLAVLLALAVVNGIAVAIGTDMDGSKGFISTAADQQSLMAFGANALLLGALLGAVASAREYATGTVIATFLSTPNRSRALRAQLTAIGLGGAVLGVAGGALVATAVAVSLPLADQGFLVATDNLVRVIAAAGLAGAVGSVLGAAVGTVVRNTGGAVTGVVVVLLVLPPVVVQLASGTAPWVPSTLATVVSGITDETSTGAAIVGLCLWALVPAVIASVALRRRDVT